MAVDSIFDYGVDLTIRANRSMVLGWFKSGLIVAGHAGTPCGTLSRARDRPGGPPRLRSDAEPWGLPDIRTSEIHKVKAHNILAKFSTKLLVLCSILRIPFNIENPSTSR